MDSKSIVIKLFTGPYNNSDAINSVLGYISTDNHKPVPIGGYGFFPITVDTAIKAFQFVDDSMQKFYPDNQKVWHLTISCDSSFNYTEVLYIAERFSSKLYDYCGLCMKVTLKTILPLSGQGLHPSKKIISSRKLLPLL